jgi:quinone-modifying oxidoreductase subunit QmoB
MERVGVFTCTGCGIGEALDIDALHGAADDPKPTCTFSHPCLCSPEGMDSVRKAIDDENLEGVILAACSSRAKQQELQPDRAATMVERVSLREQVVWSHPPGDEDTQLLAEDLVLMGLARVTRAKAATPTSEPVETGVLVVGGGVAGLEAARGASGLGHEVVLVEKEDALGGRTRGLRFQTPSRPPYDALVPSGLPDLVAAVQDDPGIRVLAQSRVKSIKGQPGQFQVEVETPGGVESFTSGAIVQATGARPYDATKLGSLGYGSCANVITSHELEAMLSRGELARPSDGQVPKRVLFVQCAGSRDPEHLPYCSSECCGTTLRQMATIHEDHPEVETITVYKDMRTGGQLERFYQAVQTQPGSLFTRGEVSAVEGTSPGPGPLATDGHLKVRLKESLLGEDVTLDADLVVLAVGMVPNSADGEAIRNLRDARKRAETGESEVQRKEAQKIVDQLAHHEGTEILNLEYRQGPDLPVLRYGFPDSHFICFPYETRRTGIYAAGTLRAPMDGAQAAEDGWGAAMKATQCIEEARHGEAVHPRSGDLGVPDFFLQRCTQCKRCTEECPFGTLNEDEKGTPQLNALRCRRCGICMGACPERIISFPDYSVDATAAAIKAMSIPDEFDEKPRILALLCENDALPALDAAAMARTRWNPWVRVAPLRCLGSMNLVWIADALSRGIDGVIIIGCKRGDDYQCHYVRGSELAHTRLTNLQETLTRLALEPERVKVVELAHDESDQIPQILDEFADELEELGASPLKGF